MNYSDIRTGHKTVLKAFSNIPAEAPALSLLQGVNPRAMCVWEKSLFFLQYAAVTT